MLTGKGENLPYIPCLIENLHQKQEALLEIREETEES
jgi:hypothetical protein